MKKYDEVGGIITAALYLIVISAILYLIVIITPIYYESMSIQSIIDTQSSHSYSLSQSAAQVRRGIMIKFASPGYTMTGKKITLLHKKGWYLIRVEYTDVVPIMYNMSLMFHFDLISHR